MIPKATYADRVRALHDEITNEYYTLEMVEDAMHASKQFRSHFPEVDFDAPTAQKRTDHEGKVAG